jgi:anti-sigma B factor antagonist
MQGLLAGGESMRRRHRETGSDQLPAVLWLSGEIDLANAATLYDASLLTLRLSAAEHITLDLAAVSFIDAAGLALLLTLRNAALESGTSLTLRNPTARTARLLSVTGLDEAFEIRNTPEVGCC